MDEMLAKQLTQFAVEKMEDHFRQVCRCAKLLSEEQLWYRPNKSSNSVANLLLHLRGNVGQWILGGLGGRPIDRDRQAEFDAREPLPREKLVEPLEAVVKEATGLISGMGEEALTRMYVIQKYNVSGVAAVFHVVEHFAFHTGQIVTTTKWLLDVDLSLYDEHGQRRDGTRQTAP